LQEIRRPRQIPAFSLASRRRVRFTGVQPAVEPHLMSFPAERSSASSLWRWGVCGLLLLATMINYMDRQTLNQTSKRIKSQFAEDNNQLYARLESGFGLAFAAGSVCAGLLVDRIGVRFYYPLMVALWSLAGFATGLVRDYDELLTCRILLGFFEGSN